MIAYVPFSELATMPPAKARAIKHRAHVHGAKGVHLPIEILAEIDAGLLNTPAMELAEIVEGQSDPTLMGNRLEAFFNRWGAEKAKAALARLGIPCNCQARRDFINHVHAKAREITKRLLGGGA